MRQRDERGSTLMKSLRILIADDDAMISNLLAETVVAKGHFVCGLATNETDAVLVAERERPDLIIIDVALNPGSGVQAIERILQAGPVAHVFISGNRQPASYHALLKPFRPAELQLAMESALAAAYR